MKKKHTNRQQKKFNQGFITIEALLVITLLLIFAFFILSKLLFKMKFVGDDLLTDMDNSFALDTANNGGSGSGGLGGSGGDVDKSQIITLYSTETTKRIQYQTFTVPMLGVIKSVKSNTGKVSIEKIEGNQVTLKMFEGAESKRVLLSGEYIPRDTKYVTNQTSASYSDSGRYAGTLDRYVASGSYTAAVDKYVTGQTSSSYSDSDGFKGTLSQYVSSGSYTPSDTIYVTDQTSSYYDKNGYKGTLSSYLYSGSYTEGASKFVTGQTSSYYSDSQGYKGTLTSYLYSGSYIAADTRVVTGQIRLGGLTPECNYEGLNYGCAGGLGNPFAAENVFYSQVSDRNYSGITIISSRWLEGPNGSRLAEFTVQGTRPGQDTRVYRYQGTVYKDAIDTQVYRYQGNVTKPASDTRVYRYQGTVTKPAVDTRVYRYQGTVIRPELDTRVYDVYYKYKVELIYDLGD